MFLDWVSISIRRPLIYTFRFYLSCFSKIGWAQTEWIQNIIFFLKKYALITIIITPFHISRNYPNKCIVLKLTWLFTFSTRNRKNLNIDCTKAIITKVDGHIAYKRHIWCMRFLFIIYCFLFTVQKSNKQFSIGS
jgi:hypothetical protein